MGGNDTITGNGNTRIAFINATGGVTVDLQTGVTPAPVPRTATHRPDTDTFTGVNAVQASMFDDTSSRQQQHRDHRNLRRRAGNDFIDGRGGFDIATYNNIYFSTGP